MWKKKTIVNQIAKETQVNSTVIGSKGNRLIMVQDNVKHVFISGTTGSGKTVLLSNFIEHGINMDYPMVIIDGKGDTGQGSIYDVLQKIKGKRKLYVVNMNDVLSSTKYNPFADTKPTIVKDMLINLTPRSTPPTNEKSRKPFLQKDYQPHCLGTCSA